jgi:CDGSH-type Zn-finger protein
MPIQGVLRRLKRCLKGLNRAICDTKALEVTRMELTEEEQIQLWIEDHTRKFCPYCRQDLSYNAPYCDNCGRKVTIDD